MCCSTENLKKPDDPEMVTHPETGRYFDEYEDAGYYKPNNELATKYPEDLDFIRQVCNTTDS